MGGCCSCFHTRDPEEDGDSPRPTRTRIGTLWNKFTGVNTSERSVTPASTSQDLVPLISNAASNNIITVGTRVLPLEGETINSGEDKDEWNEGREDSRVDHMESVRKGKKSITGFQSESQLKVSPAKPEVACACGSSEDEDVCPTCLEEYIPENPRIVLQCSHSYHLSCIYEWMERSSNCPICGKMMIFNEEA